VASVSISSTSGRKKVFKNQIGFTTFSVKRENVACSDLLELPMLFCSKKKGFELIQGK
jgi:hypothetical protein